MKRKSLTIIVLTLLVLVVTVSPALAMNYSYDNLGRLTSVTYNSGQTCTYNYDSAGNILSCNTSLGINLFTSYSLPAETEPASIDYIDHTISITVNTGTDVKNMVAEFSLSDGAIAKVGSMTQVSNTTANDFSAPVIYKIIAADGSEQDWMVAVSVAARANQIIAYSLAEQTETAVIDSTNNTVEVIVGSGTDVTNLVATYILSEGAVAQVETTAQVSGTTANDFTNPIIYKVIAADGSEQDWTVMVTVADPVVTVYENLTVTNTTGSGITVSLMPALNGLEPSSFILLDDLSQPVNITRVSTTNSGITYSISAALTIGKTYTITAIKNGYDFGMVKSIEVSYLSTYEIPPKSNIGTNGPTFGSEPSTVRLVDNEFFLPKTKHAQRKGS